MSVLHLSPDSHVPVHATATAVLYLRVGAGTVGLLAGAVAFVFRKGSRLHRQAGNGRFQVRSATPGAMN